METWLTNKGKKRQSSQVLNDLLMNSQSLQSIKNALKKMLCMFEDENIVQQYQKPSIFHLPIALANSISRDWLLQEPVS